MQYLVESIENFLLDFGINQKYELMIYDNDC